LAEANGREEAQKAQRGPPQTRGIDHKEHTDRKEQFGILHPRRPRRKTPQKQTKATKSVAFRAFSVNFFRLVSW
jgi:hypothetical protein